MLLNNKNYHTNILNLNMDTLIYTSYDSETFKEICASFVEPEEGLYTTVSRTENMCCPTFDPGTETWFDAATPQEIEAWEYNNLVLKWSLVTEHLNEDLQASDFTGKTNAEVLDPLYPEVVDRFKVYATNVGTGKMYFKMANGWVSYPLAFQ